MESSRLILLDVGLPDMDGFEVCQRVKGNPETALIPIVFLSSSHQSQQEVEKSNRAGGFAFLFHPVDMQSLFAVIHRSTAKAKADSRIARQAARTRSRRQLQNARTEKKVLPSREQESEVESIIVEIAIS